jgi:rhodanese-related sulfurtransferase
VDIKNDKSLLLDVRTPEEYSSVHAAHSINIPLDEIININLDKSKQLFVYCASGDRSQMAEQILKSKGYDAKNIGGVADAVAALGKA